MRSPREQIELAQRLWEIERRHLLGYLPTQKYRQEVAALLALRTEQNELAVKADRKRRR